MPPALDELSKRYGALLDVAVHRRIYREGPEYMAHISSELRAIADALGALHAGPREVAELHARVIRDRTRGVPVVQTQALIAEGRMMAFELMGRLVEFYRQRLDAAGAG